MLPRTEKAVEAAKGIVGSSKEDSRPLLDDKPLDASIDQNEVAFTIEAPSGR